LVQQRDEAVERRGGGGGEGRSQLIASASAMRRTLPAILAGCVLVSLVLLYARIAYRDSHYWQYDDYRWNCVPAAKDYCARGSRLDRIPHDLSTLVRTVNRSPRDPESFRAPEDQEPWNYPPKLKLVGSRGDTVDVEVVNAWSLTQSMGSTGASVFVAESVLTLTECPGIRYVNLIFEEGDHARPGRYSRDTLPSQWQIRR
jgi:hypothetical protein